MIFMKNILYSISFIILIVSCSNKKESIVVTSSKNKDSIIVVKSREENKDDSDCVFENNPEELTQTWLREAGFKQFIWDKELKKAIVINDLDTLLVYKGGCNHLVNSLEIKMPKVYDDIFDYRQMQKINDLACRFNFQNYCNKILNNQFDKMESNTGSFILEFENDDPEGNLILEGIEIIELKNAIRVKISEYYN